MHKAGFGLFLAIDGPDLSDPGDVEDKSNRGGRKTPPRDVTLQCHILDLLRVPPNAHLSPTPGP
jgi:hypothetical protein